MDHCVCESVQVILEYRVYPHGHRGNPDHTWTERSYDNWIKKKTGLDLRTHKLTTACNLLLWLGSKQKSQISKSSLILLRQQFPTPVMFLKIKSSHNTRILFTECQVDTADMLLLLCLAGLVGSAYSFACAPNICSVITAPKLHCKGGIIPDGGYCECYDSCAKYINAYHSVICKDEWCKSLFIQIPTCRFILVVLYMSTNPFYPGRIAQNYQ